MLRQPPPFQHGDDDGPPGPGGGAHGGSPLLDEVDQELQAAIEYKIAVSGLSGVATVLQFLNEAVRRQM